LELLPAALVSSDTEDISHTVAITMPSDANHTKRVLTPLKKVQNTREPLSLRGLRVLKKESIMSQSRYPDLNGKIVLVTGSSKAIGADVAKGFGRAGAKVIITGRDEAALSKVSEDLRQENIEFLNLKADVTSMSDLQHLHDLILKEFGSIDVLVALAGGLGNPMSISEMTEEGWKKTLDSDLTSKFLTVKTFLPQMKKAARGSIILMSSSAGRALSQASAAYGAAQAGTLMFMRHLAQELGPFGIRVNAIAPSMVKNEKIEKSMPPEMLKKVAEQFPLRRIGEPGDVTSAVMFLASEASSWITGHTLDVTGGKVMI
jgi:3-oxoacyl-[acyl-carrier protein] reductase